MRISLLAAILFLALTNAAFSQSSCPSLFLDGKAPTITNGKTATKYLELCNTEYAVGYSGLTRGPLWSAGHLTRQGLETKGRLVRSNKFTPDNRIPVNERAELSNWARSGYDRGHMFPAADAITQDGQDSTFLLSNMIPQNPSNNRGIHEGVESAIRYEAKKRGELYVVTGPIFKGDRLQSLKGRVIIPTGIYKCALDPARHESGCYIELNAPGAGYETTSVSKIEQMIGINLFPSLPDSEKQAVMSLPVPKFQGQK